jgi:23S rRNA pseudouridine2605 synthase
VSAVEGEGETAAVVVERPKKVGTGRITKFSDAGSERKTASDFRGKPAARGVGARAAKPAFGARGAKPAYGAKPAGKFGAKSAGKYGAKPAAKYAPRLDGKSDSERRPFKKDAKPSFTKPWDESKKPRAAAAADGFTKYRKPEPEDRAPLGPREQAGLPMDKRSPPKSTRSFDRGSARPTKPGGFAKRPYAKSGEGDERPTFKPRSYERPGGDRDEKPRSFAAKRPFTPRASEVGGGKPFAKRPYALRAGEDAGEKKPFAKRPFTPRASEGGERAARPSAARSSEGSFPKRAYKPRDAEGGSRSFTKRPFTPRTEDTGERTLPKRPYKPRAADADQRPFTKAPWTPPSDDGAAPKRAYKPRGEGGFRGKGAGPRKTFGGKPAGKFGGKPGGKTFGGGGFKRSGPAGGAKKPSAEE